MVDACDPDIGDCIHFVDDAFCDDMDPCFLDSCGEMGCINEVLFDFTKCDDGDAEISFDLCLFGACRGGTILIVEFFGACGGKDV